MSVQYVKAESVSDAKRLSVQYKITVQAPNGDLYLDGVRIKHIEGKPTVNTLPPWEIIANAVLDMGDEKRTDAMAVALALTGADKVSKWYIQGAISDCWSMIKTELALDPYEEICTPYDFGANKYTPRGWEVANLPEAEHGESARRHLSAHLSVEVRDEESGALHIACAIFHFAAVLFNREKNDE